MERKKCKPIVNGFECNVSLQQLNQFKRNNNLQYRKYQESGRTRVDLLDRSGQTVATATKYNGSDNNNIQFVSRKKYSFK